jgi:predicted ATP-dependent endonuclease of OLD family
MSVRLSPDRKFIKKIKLQNFKKFQTFSVDFDDKLNVLIGDNEAGKSSILTAIDIVLSGSRSKVETLGLDSLFNSKTILQYLKSGKKYEDLPILFVELYLSEMNNLELNGKANSEDVPCDGLQLICQPNDDLSKEIQDILKQDEQNFPFEYYSIIFKTFSGESYTGYKKVLRHILIDNTQISNEYATKEYIKAVYNSNVKDAEKNKHQNEYRKHKEHFRKNILAALNDRLTDYCFTIRTSSKANLETDLTISEDNINIENRGKGKQCFIKTEFALRKSASNLDVILIEEPENHLSHINMKKLISRINASENKQLFICTHNDLISTRLDLRKSILLNSNNSSPVLLSSLPESTATFFIKAPDNNILEFILSKKVILVEGDAEFILMDIFFQKIANEKLEDSEVHVISVDGTSFKRYLDLARLLDIKTAVIRDNDGDYNENCVNNFAEYSENNNIQVFYDTNNAIKTFEMALYRDNSIVCNELFGPNRKTLSVEEYMLKNKTDAAFKLLDKKAEVVKVPLYIQKAILWIKE